MKMNKICAFFALGMMFGAAAFAQQEEETTVEGEYMSSMDDVVVSELANSDEMENKLMALQFLDEAASNGSVSPEMMVSLERLAGEGVNTQSRTKGRVGNNFPEVRREACRILGKVGTDEAAQTLNKIVRAEGQTGETMVLNAAIYSLGEIGYNENDVSTNTIAFYSNRYLVLNPANSSSLALNVVNALEKLAGNTKDKKPVIDALQRIAGNTVINRNVRTRAKEVLTDLRGSDDSGSKKSASKNER